MMTRLKFVLPTQVQLKYLTRQIKLKLHLSSSNVDNGHRVTWNSKLVTLQ